MSAQKELGWYPAVVNEQIWSTKTLSMPLSTPFQAGQTSIGEGRWGGSPTRKKGDGTGTGRYGGKRDF